MSPQNKPSRYAWALYIIFQALIVALALSYMLTLGGCYETAYEARKREALEYRVKQLEKDETCRGKCDPEASYSYCASVKDHPLCGHYGPPCCPETEQR